MYIERDLEPRLAEALRGNKVLILYGSRQTGRRPKSNICCPPRTCGERVSSGFPETFFPNANCWTTPRWRAEEAVPSQAEEMGNVPDTAPWLVFTASFLGGTTLARLASRSGIRVRARNMVRERMEQEQEFHQGFLTNLGTPRKT
jgi:hypothetical protein